MIVIGMTEMVQGHSAEESKKALEKIINKYNFDKNKIKAVVSDQGSNFVRLFGQIQNTRTGNLK